MKSIILSYSATGNTARLVSIVAGELEKAWHSVERIHLHAGDRPLTDASAYDLVIVAFPVLAMMPPVFVRRCLRRLPTGNRVRAAVLAIDGGDGGPAAGRAAAIMRRRGYEVFLSAKATYAENWAQVGAVPESDEDVAEKTARGDARAREIAQAIVQGKPEECRVTAGMWMLGQLLGFLFGSAGRRFLGKVFVASEACTGCGICARTCPAGTITIGRGKKARPYWKMNCENCNRCVNICPKKAIGTSVAGVVLQFVSIALLLVLGIRAVNALPWPRILTVLGGALGEIVRVLLYVLAVVAAHVVSIGPADYFVYRWIRRIPGLRRVFAVTFLKESRQYSAPGFKPEARA